MKPEDIQRVKDLLPTDFGSDEIKTRYAKEILQRSIFSARMAAAHYLAKIREVTTAISSGEINAADARAQLLAVLEQMGHSPQDEGGLTNPASIRRLNLSRHPANKIIITELPAKCLGTIPEHLIPQLGSTFAITQVKMGNPLRHFFLKEPVTQVDRASEVR